MTLVAQTSNELAILFDESVQNKTRQMYQAIPGTLLKYLEKREIIKRVKFQQDFTAEQVQMGTKTKVNFMDFERALRKTIHENFISYEVTEVRAEELSAEISKRYQSAAPLRAEPGKSAPTTIKFNQMFQKKEGDFWTNVNVYVYASIEEDCQNKWFGEDKRRFSYELTIELNGISVNKDKAIQFSEKVAETDLEAAIAYFKANYPISWDEI
jgi:hypothetical protein